LGSVSFYELDFDGLSDLKNRGKMGQLLERVWCKWGMVRNLAKGGVFDWIVFSLVRVGVSDFLMDLLNI